MADFAAKTHAKEVVGAAERKSLAAFVEPVRGRVRSAATVASGAVCVGGEAAGDADRPDGNREPDAGTGRGQPPKVPYGRDLPVTARETRSNSARSYRSPVPPFSVTDLDVSYERLKNLVESGSPFHHCEMRVSASTWTRLRQLTDVRLYRLRSNFPALTSTTAAFTVIS
jgi:hypothetical protein